MSEVTLRGTAGFQPSTYDKQELMATPSVRKASQRIVRMIKSVHLPPLFQDPRITYGNPGDPDTFKSLTCPKVGAKSFRL